MNMTRYARLFYGIAARAVMPAVLALIFAFVPAVTAGYAAPAEVPPPRCDSPSCVVMDAVSGEVLFEKNSREKRHPASVTKIMTLLLTLEDVAAGKVALSDQVTASANAWEMGGTEVWAEPGETMELEEWIKRRGSRVRQRRSRDTGRVHFGHRGSVCGQDERKSQGTGDG
jgi:D-alanyl-D-alanine carboxypeptidase